MFVPLGTRCYSVHLYKDNLFYVALNMTEGNIADEMCLDSNGVVNLLKECFDTVGKTRNFDFDDSALLDNDAYYNITRFIKDKTLL